MMRKTHKKSISNDRKLGRHLALVVLVKVLILYGLWAVFVKPNKVKIDVSDVQRIYQGGGGNASRKPM